MKTLWIPLVAVIVLLAASTASADWIYTTSTGWTYVAPVYPAPPIYYPPPPPPVYVYRPPVVTVPTVIAPFPVIRTAPVVVHARVRVPHRALRRAAWTVW
jgi:hypothetical protein